MKKFITSVVLLSFIFSSTTVHADVPSIPLPITPPEEIDPGAAVSPMNKGQKAAFTGVLLSPKAVATVITELSSVGEKIKIETEKVKSEQQTICKKETSDLTVKAETEKSIFKLDAEAKGKTIDVLQLRLDEEKKSRPNVILWSGLGAAGGIAVTLLTVFAVSQATK